LIWILNFFHVSCCMHACARVVLYICHVFSLLFKVIFELLLSLWFFPCVVLIYLSFLFFCSVPRGLFFFLISSLVVVWQLVLLVLF
jgi:hypothetical protein